jgi:hypothetical protein
LFEIVIPASIEILGEDCFLKCSSLSEIKFESESKLSGIEKQTFSETETGLIEIIIPSSVEI